MLSLEELFGLAGWTLKGGPIGKGLEFGETPLFFLEP